MAIVKQAIQTKVNKAERTVECIYLLHTIIIGLEGTIYEPSVIQETIQINGSRPANTMLVCSSPFDDLYLFHGDTKFSENTMHDLPPK
jgi:hypothetical protein